MTCQPGIYGPRYIANTPQIRCDGIAAACFVKESCAGDLKPCYIARVSGKSRGYFGSRYELGENCQVVGLEWDGLKGWSDLQCFYTTHNADLNSHLPIIKVAADVDFSYSFTYVHCRLVESPLELRKGQPA